MSEYISTQNVDDYETVVAARRSLIAVLEDLDIPRDVAVHIVYDAYDLGFARGVYICAEHKDSPSR